jgi:hypothetical protein
MNFKPLMIERTLISSIKYANSEYARLTGGDEWISDRGVESYLAYFVGREFKKLASPLGGKIFLEVSIASLEDDGFRGKKILGRRGRHLNRKNRIDVVLANKKSKPIGVIELKRDQLWSSGWKSDIDRIASLVARTPVRFGAFGLFLSEREESGHICGSLNDLENYVELKQKKLSGKLRLRKFKTYCSRYATFHERRWRFAVAGCMYSKL